MNIKVKSSSHILFGKNEDIEFEGTIDEFNAVIGVIKQKEILETIVKSVTK